MTSAHGDERTDQIFSFIERYVSAEGRAPTIRDIMEALGVSSTSVVSYHIEKLERQKRIVYHRMISRGIEIVRPQRGTIVRPYLEGDDRRDALRRWHEHLAEELRWVRTQLDATQPVINAGRRDYV